MLGILSLYPGNTRIVCPAAIERGKRGRNRLRTCHIRVAERGQWGEQRSCRQVGDAENFTHQVAGCGRLLCHLGKGRLGTFE